MLSVLAIRLRSLGLLRVSGIVWGLGMFLLLITLLTASHSSRNRVKRRARLRGQSDRDLETRGCLPREVDGSVTRHRRQSGGDRNAGTRPQRIPELRGKMSKMVRAKLQAADGAGSLEFTFNPTE